MKKKFFYNFHKIDLRDIKEVVKSLKGEKITKGKYLDLFEKKLSLYLGSKYCLATSNATSAFDIVISSLKMNKSEIAILSPNTFVAAANSLKKFKKNFVFCDIKIDDPNIDTKKLENEIVDQRKKGKKVKLVVVTDYSGLPADWKELRRLKKKYDFKLINDNCHALGSLYFNDKFYALKYADIVIQSFHAVKNITTSEGGAILTNEKKLYQDFSKLREHGFVKKNYWEYDLDNPGFNSRLSEMQCALGFSQLKKLNKFLRKRKQIANFYNNYFKKYKFIKTPTIDKNKSSAHHLYYLRVNFKKMKISKSSFFKKLIKDNIFLQIHYIPTYIFSAYKDLYKKNKFKNNEKFYHEVFSIPLYVDLHKKDLKFICSRIIKNLCRTSI